MEAAGVIALILGTLAGVSARAVRSSVRRLRGKPALERAPTKRDALVEKLRELDEPYRRRERTTVAGSREPG